MRKALTPVKSRLDDNLASIKDTGGLAETTRLTVSAAAKQLERSGKKAAMLAKVTMGRTRKVDGKTGHQALQVEYGNIKIKGQAPLGRSIEGHEETVIRDLGKEWAAGIHNEARKARQKNRG
ncbi:MAG: hypothetical protein JKY34_07305 [Kordiimonadaceae bacterium]|nr:hypothetical protein [Kordiimonadaceae bacterium]